MRRTAHLRRPLEQPSFGLAVASECGLDVGHRGRQGVDDRGELAGPFSQLRRGPLLEPRTRTAVVGTEDGPFVGQAQRPAEGRADQAREPEPEDKADVPERSRHSTAIVSG